MAFECAFLGAGTRLNAAALGQARHIDAITNWPHGAPMKLTSPVRHLLHRPALLFGAAAGAVAAVFATWFLPNTPAALFAWSCGVAAYLVFAARTAGRADVKHIRMRAAQLDEGAGVILLVTVGAGVASLGAIVLELARAKGAPGGEAAVALAAITVVLSWMFIHTVFAFHYAHAYYADGGGCLDFPATEKPMYWDFIYFSFVIGMTAQVADVQTKTAAVRKLVLAHGVVAFLFNTAILALGVNLAAALAS